ncbi:MAG: helix-turn-helix domain-containing protein [Verrucomicrobiota bacterium]
MIRLSAIHALVLGFDHRAVCQLYQVSDRMLRAWIHWFNEAGIAGLISRRESRRGRAAQKICTERLEDILVPALENLEQKFRVGLGYSTVIRYLHELGYVLRFPRPWATGHVKDEAARECFKSELLELREREDIRLWSCDETGIEGDPRSRQRWAVKGSGPKIDYHAVICDEG